MPDSNMRTEHFIKIWAVIAFGLLVATWLIAWRNTVTEPGARELFHRSITQGADVPMRAELTMTWRRHGITYTAQAHVIQGGQGRYRTEYLLPREARGRVVTSDGQTEWQYEPHGDLLATTTLMPESEQNERNTEDLITQNYRIVLVSDAEITAGRRTYLLELLPRQEGKSSQKRWIDQKTFKTLRIETHYPDGILARMVAYTSSVLPARVTPADFMPPHVAGLRQVTSLPTSNILPNSGRTPSVRGLGLPDRGALGFRLTQVASSAVARAQTAHLLYSDGIESISVFVQNGGTPVPGTAPGWHTVLIQNRTAFENLDGHLDAVVWTQANYRFTAVSHLGPKALQQFVGSLMSGDAREWGR
jgi:outer membrane lipoprotein-sorting protein